MNARLCWTPSHRFRFCGSFERVPAWGRAHGPRLRSSPTWLSLVFLQSRHAQSRPFHSTFTRQRPWLPAFRATASYAIHRLKFTVGTLDSPNREAQEDSQNPNLPRIHRRRPARISRAGVWAKPIFQRQHLHSALAARCCSHHGVHVAVSRTRAVSKGGQNSAKVGRCSKDQDLAICHPGGESIPKGEFCRLAPPQSAGLGHFNG